MKKLLNILILIIISGTVYGQADYTRTNPTANNSANLTTFNKASIVDANLKARLTFYTPRVASFTLNNGKDTAGAIVYNTTTGRLGVYVGGSVWKSLATTDDSPTLFATSPIFYNPGTGVISSQAASATQNGYVTNGTQTLAGLKNFSGSIAVSGSTPFVDFRSPNSNSSGLIFSNSSGASQFWDITHAPTISGSQSTLNFTNLVTGHPVLVLDSDDSAFFYSLNNGLVKSTSGKLSNATAGTDYLTPSSLSGTTNYIPKFSGSGTLSDSPINVGIWSTGFGIPITGVNDNVNVSIYTSGHINSNGAISANQSINAGISMQSPYYSVRTSGFNGDIKSTNLTTGRVFELPNASGTIALTSDIPTNYWQKTGTLLSPVTANDVIDYTYSGSSNAFTIVNSGSGIGSQITSSSAGTSYNANISSTANGYSASMEGNGFGFQASGSNSSGFGFYSNNSSSYTGVPFRYRKNGVILWEINNSGALTGTSATLSDKLKFSASTTPTTAGDIGYSGTYGLYQFAQTGSTDDWTLFAAGGGYVAHVPTGTSNLLTAGFLKASSDGTYISSTGAYHELRTSSNVIAQISNSNASPFGLYIQHDNLTNNSTNLFIHAFEAGTQRFSVYTNGGIANYQANNVNLSDERVKKNITKAGSYWDIIKAIEFDNYKYKDQKDNRMLLGVMAQQVEKINPAWVSNSGSFGKASDGTNLKSVYEQQLQYGVNIVVQESMKRIEALEAEVKTLKSINK